MNKNESSRRGAPSIRASELLQKLRAGDKLPLLDVRELKAFAARHIGGSIHAPDSQTTGLVKKMQVLGSGVLVCGDGRLSSMIARSLGCCGFRFVAYLEGGLAAYEAAGGPVVETTRSGFERTLVPPEPETEPDEKPGFLRALTRRLRPLLFPSTQNQPV